jgi:hypothetical protein
VLIDSKGQWGSAAEIWALTKVLARPIVVYQPLGTPPQASKGNIYIELAKYGKEEIGAPVPILYVNGNHYRSLLQTPLPSRDERRLPSRL